MKSGLKLTNYNEKIVQNEKKLRKLTIFFEKGIYKTGFVW